MPAKGEKYCNVESDSIVVYQITSLKAHALSSPPPRSFLAPIKSLLQMPEEIKVYKAVFTYSMEIHRVAVDDLTRARGELEDSLPVVDIN